MPLKVFLQRYVIYHKVMHADSQNDFCGHALVQINILYKLHDTTDTAKITFYQAPQIPADQCLSQVLSW